MQQEKAAGSMAQSPLRCLILPKQAIHGKIPHHSGETQPWIFLKVLNKYPMQALSPDPFEADYQHYLEALLQGDRGRCESIVQSLIVRQIDILVLYESFFRRSLYEIGEMWAKNLISVAEEHIATAITESLLSQMQVDSPRQEKGQLRVVVSCIASDLHQIGAKMVANLFELHGWETYFLGANMPVTDLLDAIDRIQPQAICLSLALVEHIRALEVTIQEIRLRHPQTPIITGGSAFTNLDPATHAINRFNDVHILKSVVQLEGLIDSVGTPSAPPPV